MHSTDGPPGAAAQVRALRRATGCSVPLSETSRAGRSTDKNRSVLAWGTGVSADTRGFLQREGEVLEVSM